MRLQSASHRELFQVTGPPTAGKSALLRTLETALVKQGRAPVVVGPPAGALDAAPLALLEIGVGLKRHNVINGQLDLLKEPARPLAEKVELVKHWVNDAADKVVLLCDEPDSWAPTARWSGHFAAHVDTVKLLMLFSIDAPRVVTGPLPSLVRPDAELALQKESEPSDFLGDRSHWADLASAAEALLESGIVLSDYSNLELRLLVAHVALGSVDEVKTWLPRHSNRRSEISRRLAGRIANSASHQGLWEIWQRLAFVRRPITPDLLTDLRLSEIGALDRSVLTRCMLYPLADGSFILHRTLQTDAQTVLGAEADSRPLHKELARHYKRRFSTDVADDDSPSALLDEAEAFHHATESGDPRVLDQFQAFFVDQLDVLGQHLSYREREYSLAAEVFERALGWDDQDDYAHHYLAFNLDVQGIEPEKVESGYATAIDLEPRLSLWWARYITFLITRGRTNDARAAWDEATDAILLPHAQPEEFLYDHLHAWVARLLLHRGQLDFAREVLTEIPDYARSERIEALSRRLAALEEADQRGAFAPARLLEVEEWWREGPFLLDRRDPRTDDRLVRWLALRVDAVRDACLVTRGLHIVVGDPAEPSVITADISFEQFEMFGAEDVGPSAIEPGTFLELGVYAGKSRDADKTTTKIRVHRDSTWLDDALPRLFPEPARYLRRELGKADSA